MLSPRKKSIAIKSVQIHGNDTGSSDVQVAILSKKITELTNHLKVHKKDNHSRRGLLQMVVDRRSHLKYLEKKDSKRHSTVLKKVGLSK